MGVFGSAAAGPAGPAASACGSAPTCSRFWNPGPALRSIPLSARPSRRRSRRSLGAWPDCRPCAGRSPPKPIGGLSLAATGAASGRHWQVAGIGGALGGRHPWARAKPLKGDPAMRLLGQEPLRRGRATGGWQDSCAVHDSRALDGENAPWRQDVRAVRSPTVLCGAFRMHSTHILPKLAVFEYMQAICCHELVFFSSDAPS